jgi:predicted Fe-Mo cluster-binding NifX family protein
MKVFFPVAGNKGLASEVFGHFGSAPVFLLVDSESREVKEVVNRDLHHAHGACRPLRALDGEKADAIVVGGIGGGALMGLNRAGLKVFRAPAETVAACLDHMAGDPLQELSSDQVCGGHSHGGGCGH